MMSVYIGDTPEQLGSYLTADAVILDGKVITKQQVVELIQKNAELVAMVEALKQSLISTRARGNLLHTITIGLLQGGELSGSDWDYISEDQVKEIEEALRQIQADIAEKYYYMGWEHSLSTKADDGDHYACGKRLAKDFADRIKAGE